MSWASDFFGPNIDIFGGKFEVGTPQPVQAIGRLPQTIQGIPQDVANLVNPAGLALAAAVRNGKSQAAFGARPIPEYVSQRLQPYFPPDILQSVQYNTFDTARIVLDTAVMMLNNDVAAITLDDIVVFRSESVAQDPLLWAHELTHVLQYRARGIDTFANMYTTNAWVLENEAKDHAARIAQALSGLQASLQQFAYFNVNGLYLYGDALHKLYPADPTTGQVLGPPNGTVIFQNGQYFAIDSSGQAFPAIRVR
jgi:hypothetical protein